MRSHFALTRIGLWTLPISGITFIIGYILNGALPDPSSGAVATMSAFAAPRFAFGAFVNLAGMLLNPFGFFALYVYLTGRGPNRIALLGLIFSVLGLELTLTGYGVIVFDLPFLGHLFTQGRLSAEQGFAVATNPVFVGVLVFACFTYFIGSVLFSTALWRSRMSPNIVALGIALSGFFLAFGPLLPMPALWGGILGAFFLLTSGGWLALHARDQVGLADASFLKSRFAVQMSRGRQTSHPEDRPMTKYLISFPGSAMDIPDEDAAAVAEAAHAIIREARDAGVYVFGGGINEDVAPLMVDADGTVTNETYPQTREFNGGFCVLEVPSREAAVQWAAKIAKACRCSQELREFGYDPES